MVTIYYKRKPTYWRLITKLLIRTTTAGFLDTEVTNKVFILNSGVVKLEYIFGNYLQNGCCRKPGYSRQNAQSPRLVHLNKIYISQFSRKDHKC